MKLIQLSPQFIVWQSLDGQQIHSPVETMSQATGIRFLCPKCLEENKGSPVGVHQVVCWTPFVPPYVQPGPGRWVFEGNVYDTLTLKGATGKSDSVALTGGCGAHFFVRNGEITFA